MKGRSNVHRLTHQRLLEVLDYNPETGDFVWKIRPALNIAPGTKAGKKKANDLYSYIRVDGEEITASRLVWFYMTKQWPDRRVKFKNGNKLDFRFCNLELFEGIGGEGFDFKSGNGNKEYLCKSRKDRFLQWKDKDLQRNFGITLAEYGKILVEQNGACAICEQPERQMRNGKLKALAVDHDHESGNVRGLLCTDCNQAIGKLKDNRDVLLSAIRYLDKHKKLENVVSFDRKGAVQTKFITRTGG